MKGCIFIYPYDRKNTDINYTKIEKTWLRLCEKELYTICLCPIDKTIMNVDLFVQWAVLYIKYRLNEQDSPYVIFFTDFNKETDSIIDEIIKKSGIRSFNFIDHPSEQFIIDVENTWNLLTGFKGRHMKKYV